MKLQNLALVTLTGGLLIACSSTSIADDKLDGIAAFADDARLGEEVNKICFNRNIDGFTNATRNTVVLSAGPSKDYIVEVNMCPSLRYAQSVAIDSTLSCVHKTDSLLVSESAFSLNDQTGFGPDRCYIKKMHKWNKRAEKDTKQDKNTETEG